MSGGYSVPAVRDRVRALLPNGACTAPNRVPGESYWA